MSSWGWGLRAGKGIPVDLPPVTHCCVSLSGPPAGWLQPSLAVPLQDLSGIELGLAGQSLRLEWAAGAGSCVLLPREPLYCQAFLEELTGEPGRGCGASVKTDGRVAGPPS